MNNTLSDGLKSSFKNFSNKATESECEKGFRFFFLPKMCVAI